MVHQPSVSSERESRGHSYHAVFGEEGSYTVSLAGGSVSTLTLNAGSMTLLHDAGFFSAPALNVISRSHHLHGGTISNSTVHVGTSGTFNVDIGMFQNVTVSGNITVTDLSRFATV